MKHAINTSDTPAVVGAYSQVAVSGELLLTMGQLPLIPDGELFDDALVGDWTERCLENVATILAAEDASLDDVLKTTVSLGDIDDFEGFSEVYGESFGEGPPTRSAVEVGSVPKGVIIEIKAITVTE